MAYAFKEGHIKALKARAELLKVEHTFKPGDIIRWKPGMNNRTAPPPDGCAIVLEVLDTPRVDEEKSIGSTYYGEKYDIVIGVIVSGDEFLSFHMPSNRFEPMPE